jgi:hypothetical protein
MIQMESRVVLEKRIFSSNMEAYGLKKLAESLPLLFSLSLSCRAFLSHLHRASIRHLSSVPHLGCHVVREILEYDKDSIISSIYSEFYSYTDR